MAGKTLRFYFELFILCLYFNNVQNRDSILTKSSIFIKGSILFEKASDTPVTINPPTLMFSKFLNLTTLEKVIKLTSRFVEIYKDFCEDLNEKLFAEDIKSAPKYFVSDEKINLKDAEKYCRSQGGILPEIRTQRDFNNFKVLMRTNKLHTALAGIKLDRFTDTWVFISDNANIRTTNLFDGAYTGPNPKDRKAYFKNEIHTLSNQARSSFIIYNLLSDNYLRLMLLNDHTNWMYRAVCQIDNTPPYNKLASTLLLRMTAHNCKRDFQNLQGNSLIVEKETQRFARDTSLVEKSNENSNTDISIPTETINCKEFSFNYLFDKCCDNFLTFHSFLTKQSIMISKNLKISDELIQCYLIFKLFQEVSFIPQSENFSNFSFEKHFQNFQTDNFFNLQEKQLMFYFQETLAKQNSTVINETYFENFDTNTLHTVYIENILKHTRKKRNIGYGLLAGYMGINTAASWSTGEAPLGWVGSLLGDTFGWAKQSDLKLIHKLAEHQSYALQNLTINQKELEEAYNVLGQEVTRIENHTKSLEFSTATLFTELDHKLAIRELHNTIQLTLLKIANALGFAQTHKTSPYVFSREELNILSAKFKINGVSLSNSIDDVRTTAYYADNTILFTFIIPIMEDKTLFNLFEAINFPIFLPSKTIRSKIDTKYIAYSSANNEYSLLTHNEFRKCTDNHYCTISDVLRTLSVDSHCVAKTLEEANHGQSCPYEEIPETGPFFNLYDHTLVYSVKEKTSIKFICKNVTRNVGHEHESRYVEGIGAATIAPDCQILFPNGMRAFSNPEPTIENMGSVKFMETFNFLPIAENFTNIIPLPENNTIFRELKLNPIDTTAYKSVLQEIINPESALPEIIRVGIGILIFIISFVTICLIFPKVGVWFKTLTLWKNPKTWWTDYKNYDLPTFNKSQSNTNNNKNNVVDIEERETVPLKPILKSNHKLKRAKKHINRPITNAITQSLIENLLSTHRNHDSRITFKPTETNETNITNNIPKPNDTQPTQPTQNSQFTNTRNTHKSYSNSDLYPTIQLRHHPTQSSLERIDTVVIDQPLSQHEYLRQHFNPNHTF